MTKVNVSVKFGTFFYQKVKVYDIDFYLYQLYDKDMNLLFEFASYDSMIEFIKKDTLN